MYKYLLSISVLLLLSAGSFAQENTAEEQPVYLRFPTIPQFSVYKAPDSSLFTRDDLKKKMNTVIIMFSPECHHCQQETQDIIKNIRQFKNTQILMITYFPWKEMMPFYAGFRIFNYPQIIMARDNNYFFPTFFKLRNFPSTFIYDKKGNLKKSFEGTVKIEDILKEL